MQYPRMKIFLLLALSAATGNAMRKDQKYGWKDLRYDYPLYKDTTADFETSGPDQGGDSTRDKPRILRADDPDVEQNIINGEVTDYGDHPYMCTLQIRSRGSWFFICGAFVYNTNTIITAAHCVQGSAPDRFRVICGDYLLTSEDEFEVIKSIVNVTEHPDWQDVASLGFPNDIALLQPATPLVFNDFINTLPLDDGRVSLSRRCQLVGWGVTESGTVSEELRDVTTRRINNRRCGRIWRGLINSGHVCFLDRRNPSSSSCNGDSGGPAVCDGYLVGVTSWGVSGCTSGFPSVYTRLSPSRLGSRTTPSDLTS